MKMSSSTVSVVWKSIFLSILVGASCFGGSDVKVERLAKDYLAAYDARSLDRLRELLDEARDISVVQTVVQDIEKYKTSTSSLIRLEVKPPEGKYTPVHVVRKASRSIHVLSEDVRPTRTIHYKTEFLRDKLLLVLRDGGWRIHQLNIETDDGAARDYHHQIIKDQTKFAATASPQTSSAALTKVARSYLELGEYEKAMEAAEHAVSAKDGLYPRWYLYHAFKRLERFEEAIAIIDHIREKYPKSLVHELLPKEVKECQHRLQSLKRR